MSSPAGDTTYESHFDSAALFEFSTVINASLDPDFVMSHVLLTIMGKLLAGKGMVLLADPASPKEFTVEKVKGFDSSLRTMRVTIPRMPHTLSFIDRLGHERNPWITVLREAGVRILLPLMIAGKAIGALAFGPSFSRRPLVAREKTYLRSLGNISATSIEKCRTITALQLVNRRLDRKVQELNTLFELGKEFGAVLDQDKLIRLTVYSILGQVGVNRYLIALREGPDMIVAASRLDGPLPQGELLTRLEKVKKACRVDDMIVRGADDPRPVLHELGLRVVVPMQMQGQAKGLLLLGDKLSREAYADSDLEFLTSLASLSIITIENARLFAEALEKQKMENELLIARDIQKGLLPAVLPSIDGIDIAASNISSKQVGGDYYDTIGLDDGRHIIAIGDVSGKGTPAALLMANLQATIRALVPFNIGLGELTGRVNDLMCRNTGGNKFVTFFWGYVDHRKGELDYVNAGHNYPYLFHADGSVDRLDKGGMILGIMPAIIPYEEAVVPLHAGDVLVMFTDGVSEAMSKESEEFTEERLERTLREHLGRSAAAIIEAVRQEILAFTVGAPQSDDITMMVVKVASPFHSS